MKPLLALAVRLQTDDDLEAAYAQGLLRKEQLTHGAYYRGSCRNAEVARWHGSAECFIYLREKFGQGFPETIFHPADDRHFDVFRAVEAVEPTAAQRIDDNAFENVAARVMPSRGTPDRFAQREQARHQLAAAFTPAAAQELNGVDAANRAVADAAPDSTMIFLPRSAYQDLLYRAGLSELKSYKGKHIVVVSDPFVEPQTPEDQ